MEIMMTTHKIFFMSYQLLILCSLAALLLISAQSSSSTGSVLRIGFYQNTCPSVEFVVRNAVDKFIFINPGIGAGLLRLHFHDCFVRGCDGSVLLDPKSGGPQVEKDHPANKGSLRGFEVIDAAKSILETLCPKTVSCADILAFAARDSALRLGKIWYEVPAGRRDGTVSLSTDVVGNLPPPFFNASQNAAIFANKGFSVDEMVTLSGAHSIGVSHCTSFSSRLYPTVDPTFNPSYAAMLKTICPQTQTQTQSINPTVNQDPITPNCLDNKYYLDLIANKGLFTSDQTMLTTQSTAAAVLNNARNGWVWAEKFAAAMVKMGNIGVLTGKGNQAGEIRFNCRLKN